VKSTGVAKEQFIHFRRFTVLDELPKQWHDTHAVEKRTQQSARAPATKVQKTISSYRKVSNVENYSHRISQEKLRRRPPANEPAERRAPQ
jgi:hypothetical protein